MNWIVRGLPAVLATGLVLASSVFAEIPKPEDAPDPLPPAESARAFRVPAGMKVRLLASEPLIHEPSGVAWDERGRLFVCELHGYNLEGQIDIDQLNRTGRLDLEVRRVTASEEAKKQAGAATYGTVKRLLDTDGDGEMDESMVWAERLPPCYGIVPANGGLIVACAPEIVFLKDADGDNRPEIRETLFTGFATGALERGINNPTWGEDGWIYFGRGWPGGTIRGPHLAGPVELPATDFRIRADGSAIEPVSGSTKTFGMAFASGGDRFVTTTTHPGLFVAPIPWRYLERNPDAPAPALDEPASEETRVYPIAPVHPWRRKREQHAGYFAFYRKVSLSDAVASGYFTSACGPLVYRDDDLPGLRGHYLVCEPAQNLVHRAEIVREGTRLRLRRAKGEETNEFLASRDPWFHPIRLAHTPWGGIAIVDFYREIIEDYSAIPRHLQQQYGVVNGRDRGRVWILESEGARAEPAPDLDALDRDSLRRELQAERFWRRETARRLLAERNELPDGFPLRGWRSDDAGERVLALRAADEGRFAAAPEIEREILAAGFETGLEPPLALQAALSLGQSRRPEARDALVRLARVHGDLKWMDAAVASSAPGAEREILLALAGDPGKGAAVIANLAGVIAGRADGNEIAECLAALEAAGYPGRAREVLRLGLEESKPLENPLVMPEPAAPTAGQLALVEKRLPEYLAAIRDPEPSDPAAGKALFAGLCAACHRAKGLGVAVGPDLDAEFQRAPETILRDLLFPHESVRPGYETVVAKTPRGETLVGIAVSDSPTSVTLRMQGGGERTLLRKRTSLSTRRNVSLMPAAPGESLAPRQAADLISFLREPATADAGTSRRAGERPNFVLLLVDDMGHAGVSCFGNPYFQTPEIDRLAAGGLRLTDFHSSGNVCSPTRAGLLTGRYQQRAGIEAVIHPAADHAEHRKGLRKKEATFAELLQTAGYATGLIGKWHLGYPHNSPDHHPQEHGFDEFIGYHSGNIDFVSHVGDHNRHDWWHGRAETKEEGYVTDLINRYSVEFIERHHERPFCLYVSHLAIHNPVQVRGDPAQRTEAGWRRWKSSGEAETLRKFEGMTLPIDEGVGMIRAALEKHGIAEKTLVFFLTDNGPTPEAPSGNPKWRGLKGSVYEGGHRVPFIASWPGTIAPGRESDAPGMTIDLMPTMLALAGVAAPAGHVLDGVDLSGLLLRGEAPAPRPLYWAALGNNGARSEAMREGPWKLVVNHPKAKPGSFENERAELYRLDRDPSEKTDLAAAEPERTAAMFTKLKAWYNETRGSAPAQPGGWPDDPSTP